MDQFTETRQRLGRALYGIMKKVNTSGHIQLGEYTFFARGEGGADQNYIYAMGFEKGDHLGVMAIRKRWNAMEDAVSDCTTIEDMEKCIALIPEAEEYMLKEQKRFEDVAAQV